MKKRIGSLFLVLALCLSLMPMTVLAEDATAWDGSVATAFAGGSGTENDPYQIDDGAQLAYLASEVNKGKGQTYKNSYFVLTADIDLANNNWTPIGNSFADVLFDGPDYRLFAGNLDGKGHTISNISIGTESTPLESDVFGLFGATGGKISNLNLDGVTICGIAKNVSVYVIGLAGALAGSASGPIENCHVTKLGMTMNTPDSGSTAAYWIGGLVGVLDGSQHIKECSASGTIKELSGKGSIGGLIGELGRAAKITYSHADVALDVESDSRGGADVGGLIGKGNGKSNPETVISNCYATGNVTGGAYSGGFAGSLWGINIKNCYATGDVTGAFASMATFAGTDASDEDAYGSVTNCYTTGTLSGKAAYMYAFTMQQKGTPRSPTANCYFADTNSALINLNETTVFKALAEMQTEGFKDTLNANDPANGWLFREGKTPLCGAEPADYSAVYAALDKIPADLTAYTDESIKTLSAAAEAVIRGKVIAKQTEVDAMAAAIERAISDLTFKPADYTTVDAAIAKANALNENDYRDFSAVKKAIADVVRDKNITEQSKVDAMAKAIEDAIAGLVARPSSSSSKPSYSVTAPGTAENGSVTVSPKNATKGSTVTVTVKPDDGYQLDKLTVADAKGGTISVTDKGNGKYTFTMPASKVTVTPIFVKIAQQPTGKTFSDVEKSDWFADAVAYVTEKGLMNGTGSDTFSPNASTTRGMLMTVLARYAGTDTTGGAPWYQKGMEWAKANSVSDGTNPEVNITREQLVTMLYRYAGSPATNGSLDNFSDAASVSSYAVNAMQWAVANGIVNGSNGKLNPQNNATRAEVAAILMRFCEMSK
ncbi:MAG: S-layer homology domain-containing protein [Firmicutes bacterium]|nr:S-layer homology domain-containing protein [Bacillota bacterium]